MPNPTLTQSPVAPLESLTSKSKLKGDDKTQRSKVRSNLAGSPMYPSPSSGNGISNKKVSVQVADSPLHSPFKLGEISPLTRKIVSKRRRNRKIFVEMKKKVVANVSTTKKVELLQSVNDIVFSFRGKAMRELRKAANLSLDELSILSQTSKSFLSGIENGSRKPSDSSLLRIANALNVPVNYFDLKAMVLGSHLLSPTLQNTAQKIGPILDEMLQEIKDISSHSKNRSDLLPNNIK